MNYKLYKLVVFQINNRKSIIQREFMTILYKKLNLDIIILIQNEKSIKVKTERVGRLNKNDSRFNSVTLKKN